MSESSLRDKHDVPTPRTDAEIQKGWPYPSHQGVISADFARQLERELAEANKMAAHWEEAFHTLAHAPLGSPATPDRNAIIEEIRAIAENANRRSEANSGTSKLNIGALLRIEDLATRALRECMEAEEGTAELPSSEKDRTGISLTVGFGPQWTPAIVTRLDGFGLGYVDAAGTVVPFTFDKIEGYRGEQLKDIGLRVGAQVSVTLDGGKVSRVRLRRDTSSATPRRNES